MPDASVISADQVIRGIKNPSHVGLASRLRAARKQAGVNRQALTQLAGVANGVVHGIEEEGVAPRLDICERIARALGMSPCVLAFNVDAAPSADGSDPQCATVGVRLLQSRTARGQGLRALARIAGVTPTSISNIEVGKAMPTVRTLEKLAKALGCDPCWLAYGAGTAPDLTPPAA